VTANWHETCTANAKPPRSRSEHGETGPRPGPRSNAAEKRPPPHGCRSAAFSFVRGNGGEIASDEVIGSREINRVNRNRRVIACGVAALAAAGGARVAAAAETFEQALRESDFIVDMRLRYEDVEQKGFSEDAEALTSRVRAGLQT